MPPERPSLDPWRQLHPGLDIHVFVEGGHPVDSCLEAAARASLLVVGPPVSKHPRIGSPSVAVVPVHHTPALERDLVASA